jgi:tetratricopeptide (TPR) repeat protein
MWPWQKRQPEGARKDAKAVRAELLWKQGQRLMERKRFDRAIVAMRDALELEPSRLEGRLNLGAALYLTGQAEEAVTHLRYVLAFDPQNTSALLNLAACYDALGQVDEAIETLEKLVADRPSWKDAHYNLAVAYYKRELYEKAMEALKAELRLNPHHEAARTLLNKIYLLPPRKTGGLGGPPLGGSEQTQ